MTTDRIFKYNGTNDQNSRVSTMARNYYKNMTKKQKQIKYEEEQMIKSIPNKCVSYGCKNQMMTTTSKYTNKTTTISCYCEEH